MKTTFPLAALAAGLSAAQSSGPACLAPSSGQGSEDPPLVPGSGWTAQSVSVPPVPDAGGGGGNLTAPRSLAFDDLGNLLVVEQLAGIRRLRLVEVRKGMSSCIEAVENSWVVRNENVSPCLLFFFSPYISLFLTLDHNWLLYGASR